MKRMKWYELAEQKRKSLDLSQSELADEFSVSQATIGNWLNNRREVNIELIARLLNRFGVSEVLLHSDGSVSETTGNFDTHTPKIKIKGSLTFKSEPVGEFEELDGRYFTFYSNSQNTYAYQVLGSKLEPRIVSGEYIVVDPRAKLQNYDEVLLKLKNGKYMIRVLLTGRGEEWRYADPNTMKQDTDFNSSEIDTMEYIAAIVKPPRN